MVGTRKDHMSRVQLALNVGNLNEAIDHYTKLFGVGPAKIRDGYANFAIADPPLKLVLIEGHGDAGTLNHVGVEVENTDEVAAKIESAISLGLPIEVQESTTCCLPCKTRCGSTAGNCHGSGTPCWPMRRLIHRSVWPLK